MKKVLLLLVFLLTSFLYAQDYKEMIASGNYTVHQIIEKANEHFNMFGKGKGTGHKQFKRWEYNALRLMDEQGYLRSTEEKLSALNQAKTQFANSKMADVSNWEELGPTTWDSTEGWNPGVGRITSFAVQENDQDHIIVGSPTGGLWKTVNGGTSWTVLTDTYANMDVYSLTMDPTNPNIYYWGSSSGIIFKSVDAGANWTQLANLAGNDVNKILIDPTNTQKIFCSIGNAGIYRSTDGGASWTKAISAMNRGYDIEFKPGDTNTVYASGDRFYRSTDGGANFTQIVGSFNTSAKMMGVSIADASVVYVVEASGSIFGGFYISTDSGQSFTERNHSGKNYFGYSDSASDTRGQAPRDMDIDVSPTNINEVHIAGIHSWRSLDAGVSFQLSSYWTEDGAASRNVGYCHADIDIIDFVGNNLFVGSDGGIFKATNTGGTMNDFFYTDLTFGLGIRQFYKIGITQTNPVVMVGGAQDNGSSFYNTSGQWFDWLGADGMEGFVDKNNSSIFYGTSQYGSLYKSTNGGITYSGLSEPDGKSGNWVTPFEQDPIDQNVIYGGYDQVYKSTNGGSTWTSISQTFGNLNHLKIAPNNNQIIFAARGTSLYKTSNGGSTNWTTLSGFNGSINSIAIHPTNANLVAIATTDSDRVFISTDGGINWSAKRLNLPNFSALALAWDASLDNRLYLGMDYGIYYLDDNDPTLWQVYSNNLPNVIINELEINSADNHVYAATYGRGAWRSPLPPQILPPVSCTTNVSSLPYTESFEVDFADWNQVTGDAGDWLQINGATPSTGSGPSAASQGTGYVYVEASTSTTTAGGVGGSATVVLESPCIDLSSFSNIEFTFDYHTYGTSIPSASLLLQGSTEEGAWFNLFSAPMVSQDAWISTSVDLSGYTENMKLRFVGTTGSTGDTWSSDLAIDNVGFSIMSSGACAGGLKTWNGSWSPTGAPDNTNEVVIAANYNTAVNGDIDACTLTVNSGVTLTVGADDYASVEGDITVNGTLDVVHTGSIVQVDAAAVTTNNGNINVNLTTPVLEGRDYTILGSPMSLETNAVFTGAWRVLAFNSLNFVPHPGVAPGGTNWADDNGDFYNPHTGVLNPCEGYLVRPQANNTGAPTSYDYTFDTGTLNSGDITYVADNNGIANGTPQVIANPYASAISASDFMTANPSIGAIYFWEHLTQPTAALPGPGGRDFDMDDISYHNGTMGIPAANDPGNAMGTASNGVISTGQGFGVRTPGASGTTNITFTNAMRLTSGNTTLRNPVESEQLLLELRSKEYGIGSFAGIAFLDTATVGYDPGMETNRLATTVSLFSQIEGNKGEFGIQSLGAFDDSVTVDLGFNSQVEANMNFEISINKVTGVNLENVTVYLLDRVSGVETNLSVANHTFTSINGTFENRFQLRFERSLGSEDVSINNVSLYPNPTTGKLNIASPNAAISAVAIYDVRGRLVASEVVDTRTQLTMDLSNLESAMYFVQVTTEAGTITKRIAKR